MAFSQLINITVNTATVSLPACCSWAAFPSSCPHPAASASFCYMFKCPGALGMPGGSGLACSLALAALLCFFPDPVCFDFSLTLLVRIILTTLIVSPKPRELQMQEREIIVMGTQC